jgi:hypothetical protein
MAQMLVFAASGGCHGRVLRISLSQRRRGPRVSRAASLAGRPYLPALRRHQSRLPDQSAGRVPLCRSQVPQGFHRHHELAHGAQPHRASQVGASLPFDVFEQKGRLRPSTPSDVRHHLSVGLVHGASHPRTGGLTPLGGEGKIVEADETYYGPTETPRPRNKYSPPPTKRGRSGPANKRPILALVERGGNVRTFHVPVADKASVHKIVTDNIARESRLHTDESKLYGGAAAHFAAHETVRHSAGEYVRDDVHTNSAEGYFSIFKRGMRGVYQHCGEKHLHRYLAEYDFRYNNRVALGVNDGERAALAVKNATGKRLTYRQPHEA